MFTLVTLMASYDCFNCRFPSIVFQGVKYLVPNILQLSNVPSVMQLVNVRAPGSINVLISTFRIHSPKFEQQRKEELQDPGQDLIR